MIWLMDERFEELNIFSYLVIIYVGRRYSFGCLCFVGSIVIYRLFFVVFFCYCIFLFFFLFGGGSSKFFYGCY